MRRLTSALGLGVALAATAFSAGCPNREVAAIDPNQQKEEKKLIPVGSNRNIDILFVIDNSGSMGQEQASLGQNFPMFMSVLRNITGGLPNVHIGVVSSNVGVGGYNIPGCTGNGDNGALQAVGRPLDPNQPNVLCTDIPTGKPFIEDVTDSVSGTHTTNYPMDKLEDTFTCIATLGTKGCGFEQHLESMKRGLDGTNAGNAAFLRKDAYLAIIIIADEDDCSAVNSAVFDPNDTSLTGTLGPLESFRCTEFGITCDQGNLTRAAADYTGCVPRTDSPYIRNPQDYVNFVKGLKDDPNLIIVSGIIGNPEPVRVSIVDGKPKLSASCSSTANGTADPAVRLKYFLDQFPGSTFTSICNNDLSAALTKIAEALARIIGNPCLEGDISDQDLNPNAPGLQIECSVADVRYPGTEQESSKTIRRCEMQDDTTPVAGQAHPCWYAKKDASCNMASTPSGLQLLVERDTGADPPTGTYVQASCVSN
jgi:hypothetical protein